MKSDSGIPLFPVFTHFIKFICTIAVESNNVANYECLKFENINLEEQIMDAVMVETAIISAKFDCADELGLCPECGAVMSEIDRLNESAYTYIWLKCSKSGCDGQWLQRKPRQNLSAA